MMTESEIREAIKYHKHHASDMLAPQYFRELHALAAKRMQKRLIQLLSK